MIKRTTEKEIEAAEACMAQIQQTKAGGLVIDISSQINLNVKGANVKNEKVNKKDANIKDGFDNDEGSEAKNKPKVDTKAGDRETLPIRGDSGVVS